MAVVLNWMGPHSYQILNNLTFPKGMDNKKLFDDLQVLGGHFNLCNEFFKVGINVVVCTQVSVRIKWNF